MDKNGYTYINRKITNFLTKFEQTNVVRTEKIIKKSLMPEKNKDPYGIFSIPKNDMHININKMIYYGIGNPNVDYTA